MTEKFIDALNRLKDSDEFKKLSTNEFLIHGFVMITDGNASEWQIGYYNDETDRITTFVVGKEITRNPEAEMLKQEAVKELDVENINVDLTTALERAEKCQRENYKGHEPLKQIVLIQKLEIGQVWNITYLTKTYKTINFKIDSKNGKILAHEMIELFNFSK